MLPCKDCCYQIASNLGGEGWGSSTKDGTQGLIHAVVIFLQVKEFILGLGFFVCFVRSGRWFGRNLESQQTVRITIPISVLGIEGSLLVLIGGGEAPLDTQASKCSVWTLARELFLCL